MSATTMPTTTIIMTETKKHSQLLATLQWVDDNYEWAEGICVPRYVLYQHYLHFCQSQGFHSAGPATFGKIIRQRFPKLTTRRLGTRGQSRYHYYGIGIKETSPHHKQVFNGQGLSRFSGTAVKSEKTIRKRYSLSSKSGTLLPEFPSIDDITVHWDTEDKARTFLVMYHTHCQRILDTVISADFEEVQNLLLHFWQGMPAHLTPLLRNERLAYIITACDVILYKVINEVFVPSTIQEIPESLCTSVKQFIRSLPSWLESSLEGYPNCLRRTKMEVVNWFVTSMRRQLSFIYLAHATRAILSNALTTRRVAEDLATLDMEAILAQMTFLTKMLNPNCAILISKQYGALLQLLAKQGTSMEDFLAWIDDVIDSHLLEGCHRPTPSRNETSTAAEIYHFLLPWSYFVSLITRDLTIQNSFTFGPVHLMHMMFSEYIYLVLETQKIRALTGQLRSQVSKSLKAGAKFNIETVSLEVDNCATSRSPTMSLDNSVQRGCARRLPFKDTSASSEEPNDIRFNSKLETALDVDYSCVSNVNDVKSPAMPSRGLVAQSNHGNFDDDHLRPYVDTIPPLDQLQSFQDYLSLTTESENDRHSPQVNMTSTYSTFEDVFNGVDICASFDYGDDANYAIFVSQSFNNSLNENCNY